MGSDHSYGGHDRSLITPLTSTMSWGKCGWPCRMALSKIMNMHPATSAPATSSLGLKSERRTAGTPASAGVHRYMTLRRYTAEIQRVTRWFAVRRWVSWLWIVATSIGMAAGLLQPTLIGRVQRLIDSWRCRRGSPPPKPSSVAIWPRSFPFLVCAA
jgi:hypothetical protein